MVLLQRKLYFSKDPEGIQHFLGGGGGGVQLFPGCDFPGGSETSNPPSGSAHGTGTCTSQESGTVYPGNEAL